MVAGPGFEPGTFGIPSSAYFRGRVRLITIGVNSKSMRIHWLKWRSRLVRCVSLCVGGYRWFTRTLGSHWVQHLRKHGVDRGGVLLLFPFEDVSIHIKRNSDIGVSEHPTNC